MMIRNIRFSLMALGACAALLSTSAHATWTFDTTGTKISNGSVVSNTGTYSYLGSNAGDAAVSLTGFYVSNTQSSGKLTGNWTSSAGNVGTAGISNSTTGLYSHGSAGLGMYTGSDSTQPNHALDNSQYTESVLINFGTSTVLNSIGLGYVENTSNPSEIGCRNNTTGIIAVTTATTCGTGTTNVGETADVSVFRWVGADTGPTLAGTAAGTMTGWELVGNYGDMVYDKNNPYNLVNSSGKTSTWWLISAYNSGFKQNTTGIATENRTGGLALTDGDDFFKLYAVAATKCTAGSNSNGVCGGTNLKVPEPASLALTSVALLGMAGLRRRQAKTVA